MRDHWKGLFLYYPNEYLWRRFAPLQSCLMQRLFSMFPIGRPGVGLFLVRLSLGCLLMHSVSGRTVPLGSYWFLGMATSLAVALILGIVTPLITVLCIVLELWTLVIAGGGLESVNICALIDAVAVALLGPGGYSLDAKLFGRRHVVILTRGSTSTSHM
jgi:hypothetical protein